LHSAVLIRMQCRIADAPLWDSSTFHSFSVVRARSFQSRCRFVSFVPSFFQQALSLGRVRSVQGAHRFVSFFPFYFAQIVCDLFRVHSVLHTSGQTDRQTESFMLLQDSCCRFPISFVTIQRRKPAPPSCLPKRKGGERCSAICGQHRERFALWNVRKQGRGQHEGRRRHRVLDGLKVG